MSEKRSLIALARFGETSQKFDYFVLGLSSALCAYIAQGLVPERLGLNAYTLQLMALAGLISSVFFGFKRAEILVSTLLTNHQLLHALEARGELMARAPFQHPIMNKETGGIYTPDQILAEIETFGKQAAHLEPELEKLREKAVSYYRWRNRFLALGFITLVAARIASPYLSASASAKPTVTLTNQLAPAGIKTNVAR